MWLRSHFQCTTSRHLQVVAHPCNGHDGGARGGQLPAQRREAGRLRRCKGHVHRRHVAQDRDCVRQPRRPARRLYHVDSAHTKHHCHLGQCTSSDVPLATLKEVTCVIECWWLNAILSTLS
jgi:hypothetical protein